MKIIRSGREQLDEIRFECDNCGCVFEATKKEYELANYIESAHDNIKAKCKCPYCSKIACAYNSHL